MSLHNDLMIIKDEMKKQFYEIVSSLYNYHDQIEGSDTSVLTKKNYKFNDNIHKGNEIYSSEEEIDLKHNINIEDNVKKNQQKISPDNNKTNENTEKGTINEEKKRENNESKDAIIEPKKDIIKESRKNPYFFLSDNIDDFKDNNYNFIILKNVMLYLIK